MAAVTGSCLFHPKPPRSQRCPPRWGLRSPGRGCGFAGAPRALCRGDAGGSWHTCHCHRGAGAGKPVPPGRAGPSLPFFARHSCGRRSPGIRVSGHGPPNTGPPADPLERRPGRWGGSGGVRRGPSAFGALLGSLGGRLCLPGSPLGSVLVTFCPRVSSGSLGGSLRPGTHLGVRLGGPSLSCLENPPGTHPLRLTPPPRPSAALLLSCPPPARGQAPRFTIRQDPQAARLGGNVTFALELLPSGVVSCSWHRAPTASLEFEIFTYFKQPDLGQQNGPAYTERETGAADCSMHISRLRLNDTGAYTVAVRHPTITTASINLTVYGESLPPVALFNSPGPLQGDPPSVRPSILPLGCRRAPASTEPPPRPPSEGHGEGGDRDVPGGLWPCYAPACCAVSGCWRHPRPHPLPAASGTW